MEEMLLKSLQEEYEQCFQKKPYGFLKNNATWLQKKINEKKGLCIEPKKTYEIKLKTKMGANQVPKTDNKGRIRYWTRNGIEITDLVDHIP